MDRIEKLKTEIDEKQNELQRLEDAVSAARTVLDKSENENLILRAKACIMVNLGISFKEPDIGKDIAKSHVQACNFPDRGWFLTLTEDEQELYCRISNGFDEVDFVFSTTMYDEYDSGFFFRRS